MGAPGDGEADAEHEDDEDRDAEETGEQEGTRQRTRLGSDDGEAARVERIDRGGHRRPHREAEGDGGTRENRHDGRGQTVGVGEAGGADRGDSRRGDQQYHADRAAHHLARVAPQGAHHHRQSQAENVCNHSRPSTSPRPPASSR